MHYLFAFSWIFSWETLAVINEKTADSGLFSHARLGLNGRAPRFLSALNGAAHS